MDRNQIIGRCFMESRENSVIAGTLLLAAQSGMDPRKAIVRYAKKAGRKAEGVVEEFADAVSKMVDAVGDKAEDILGMGKDLAHDAKKELIAAIEEGQKRLEMQKARLEKLIV